MKQIHSAAKNYQIFPHTADIGLSVEGKTLDDLFINAAHGMQSILVPVGEPKAKKTIRFSLKSDSLESLLVEWLTELLFMMTDQNISFTSFKIQYKKPNSIVAVGSGEKIASSQRTLYREIKAVTYHNLKVTKSPQGYKTKIIFDI